MSRSARRVTCSAMSNCAVLRSTVSPGEAWGLRCCAHAASLDGCERGPVARPRHPSPAPWRCRAAALRTSSECSPRWRLPSRPGVER
jgi:hypothetical protein